MNGFKTCVLKFYFTFDNGAKMLKTFLSAKHSPMRLYNGSRSKTPFALFLRNTRPHNVTSLRGVKDT